MEDILIFGKLKWNYLEKILREVMGFGCMSKKLKILQTIRVYNIGIINKLYAEDIMIPESNGVFGKSKKLCHIGFKRYFIVDIGDCINDT